MCLEEMKGDSSDRAGIHSIMQLRAGSGSSPALLSAHRYSTARCFTAVLFWCQALWFRHSLLASAGKSGHPFVCDPHPAALIATAGFD